MNSPDPASRIRTPIYIGCALVFVVLSIYFRQPAILFGALAGFALYHAIEYVFKRLKREVQVFLYAVAACGALSLFALSKSAQADKFWGALSCLFIGVLFGQIRPFFKKTN